jgi:molybdopterin/thiamine biosynthesis adenylyltransferase/nitroreductase
MTEPSALGVEVLDDLIPGDASRVGALTRAGVDRIDTSGAQRTALSELMPSLPDQLRDEPLRWVYYPWRNAIVRILGPLAFRALRTDRNRNKITREEQAELGSRVIGVVGLSVGHVIAYTLAMEGLCRELRLADLDVIELSNLNRIPASVFDLGVNKAVVAGRRIAELDPYLPVRIVEAGLTEDGMEDFVSGLDLVVEECDSLDMKVALRACARRHRVPLIMETSDRGLLDVERYDLEPDRPLFHGLLGDVSPADLRGLSTHDKVPHVLRILEPDQLSARMAASMTEVDETVHTWPQLASDVMLGAASVATTVRALGVGDPVASGRVRIDLRAAIASIAEPLTTSPEAAVPFEPDVIGPDLRADPPTELPEDPRVRDILDTANRAPSGGNVQPWTLQVDDDTLTIGIDPARSTTMDVDYRGSLVAVGAALFNARVAAARHGLLGEDEVTVGAGPAEATAVLHLRPGIPDGAPSELARLYDRVHSRASNRHIGERTSIDDKVLQRLLTSVTPYGAGLTTVTDVDALGRIAELLGESDRLRYLTPHLHREMIDELRWPASDDLRRGLDVRTLELDESDLAKLEVARRGDVMQKLADWNVGRALGEPTRDRVLASSAIAVVTAPDRTPGGWIQAGQAVEAFWIAAEAAGLAVQPISPVFLFADTDEQFRDLSTRWAGDLAALSAAFRSVTGVGDAPLALVLRLGHCPPPSLISRRAPVRTAITSAERLARV